MLVLNSLLSNFKSGAVFLLPIFFLSCAKDERPLSALEQQGKTAYNVNCTSCHNSDPKLPGSIGPEVHGSSLELLTARTMYQSYPPGYRPKRDTHLMPVLPYVQKDLPAIHAYLNLKKELLTK
jgi:mono/diheme cytochrome c family protein